MHGFYFRPKICAPLTNFFVFRIILLFIYLFILISLFHTSLIPFNKNCIKIDFDERRVRKENLNIDRNKSDYHLSALLLKILFDVTFTEIRHTKSDFEFLNFKI